VYFLNHFGILNDCTNEENNKNWANMSIKSGNYEDIMYEGKN